MEDPYRDRKRLTFEQAEGREPLPTQLQPKELSQHLRAVLWKVVYESMRVDHLRNNWRTILYDRHVFRAGGMPDEFKGAQDWLISDTKAIFSKGDYVKVFGFLQDVLRHPRCPGAFAESIQNALKFGHAAYRVLDDYTTIVPITSEQEHQTLHKALVDLRAAEFHGARKHLVEAGAALTTGDYPGSIRESIHAVESVVRTIAPAGKFSDAVAKLDKLAPIHGALRSGITAIYGYTSDEQGIRHPLLEPGSKVDETDALFMLSACAGFVSYLISKAREAGLLQKQ